MSSVFLYFLVPYTTVFLLMFIQRIWRSLFIMTIKSTLPYFGKRKQVTYHPNLSYWCFHNSHNELFFQAKFHAETLILLRDMLGKTSWYSIDVSVNDRHILLFYEKCHFCHLLPFAKLGQYCFLAMWSCKSDKQCIKKEQKYNKNKQKKLKTNKPLKTLLCYTNWIIGQINKFAV